jgi:hypothetical protein
MPIFMPSRCTLQALSKSTFSKTQVTVLRTPSVDTPVPTVAESIAQQKTAKALWKVQSEQLGVVKRQAMKHGTQGAKKKAAATATAALAARARQVFP